MRFDYSQNSWRRFVLPTRSIALRTEIASRKREKEREREREREQVPDLTALPLRDRIFNRVAIIQHAQPLNLGPRASLVPNHRER